VLKFSKNSTKSHRITVLKAKYLSNLQLNPTIK